MLAAIAVRLFGGNSLHLERYCVVAGRYLTNN